MKILMVNKFLYPNGGSETYIFELGKELERSGHEVQYFGMEHEGRIVGNHAESYTADMDFHTGKLRKLIYPFRIIYSVEARKKIRQVLDDFRPDVVHLNNINFQITPSILYEIRSFGKKTGKYIPIVYTAHDYQWVCPNHMMMVPSTGELCFACKGGEYRNCSRKRCIHDSRIKSFLGTIEASYYKRRRTYALVDKIICPSDFMKRQLDTDEILAGKTVMMHNFLVKTAESTSKKNRTLPDKYVLYFGRFSKEKGTETLLKVCRALPEIPFVFAGTGPLEEKVRKEKNVVCLGFLQGGELRSVIEGAYFCVYPSEWYENCPFSVMESQLYGTPMIASDLGGTPELIKSGMTGELFRAGDEEELAEHIHELWQDEELCRKYRENCKSINFDTVKTYCDKIVRKIYT